MDNMKIMERVADYLTGIEYSDLTPAEKYIFKELNRAKLLKIDRGTGEFAINRVSLDIGHSRYSERS